jgi:translocation and assembly module TamB
VVVVGRERPVASRRTPLPLDVDASFDFGSGFRIQQQGLDATLSGRLRLQTDATGQLLAEGTINVDRGTYLAYGQTLSIDNGRLHFSGPANNPGLDITALRRNLPVQAGVRITGTARTPLVQLVSEPPMPDNEKLSWLILGRSVSTTSTADAAMLASAAEALLAGPSGIPFTTRVARQFGFDEFGLRSRGDEGDAVALGRQLSDRVYLFLERGIGAATTILVAEFTLTRELRLRAEAGDVNGLGITWRRMLE